MSECKTCDYAFVGKGKVYAQLAGSALLFLGNVNNYNISSDITVDKLPNNTETGGGTCATRTYVNASTSSMDLWNYCPQNFALFTGGKSTDNSVATITGETHTAYQGGLITFNELYDKSVPPVVTGHTADVDYALTETGIVPIVGGGIADGSTVTIGYTSVATSTIQALTDLGKEMKLVFEGLNDANTGKRVRVVTHRFQPSPSDSIPLITDEFTPATVSGENLRDSSITGDDESQFYKVDIEHV